MRISVAEEDVFSFLKAAERRGDRYDLIILDPPSFTRARDKINDALRGYRELHLRSARLLTRRFAGDVLVLASRLCQGVRVVGRGRLFRREAFGADNSAACARVADHPVLLHMPETFYLKGLFLDVPTGR